MLIYADGARAWSKAAKVLKVPCFQVNHQHKEYASTIRKVPKDCPRSVEHRPLIQIGNC